VMTLGDQAGIGARSEKGRSLSNRLVRFVSAVLIGDRASSLGLKDTEPIRNWGSTLIYILGPGFTVRIGGSIG
jgi:hypothetical protein